MVSGSQISTATWDLCLTVLNMFWRILFPKLSFSWVNSQGLFGGKSWYGRIIAIYLLCSICRILPPRTKLFLSQQALDLKTDWFLGAWCCTLVFILACGPHLLDFFDWYPPQYYYPFILLQGMPCFSNSLWNSLGLKSSTGVHYDNHSWNSECLLPGSWETFMNEHLTISQGNSSHHWTSNFVEVLSYMIVTCFL